MVFFSPFEQAEITRSKEEARKIIEGYQARIKSGETTLGDLAITESDCSSARKRGDLGYFGHGDMQAAFEEAAFALEVQEVSGVVDTASGLHLIERYVCDFFFFWPLVRTIASYNTNDAFFDLTEC